MSGVLVAAAAVTTAVVVTTSGSRDRSAGSGTSVIAQLASRAAARPDDLPAAGEYFYRVATVDRTASPGGVSDKSGHFTPEPLQHSVVQEQSWTAFDGAQWVRVTPGSGRAAPATHSGAIAGTLDQPTPAYVAALPTDPDALLTYLRRRVSTNPLTPSKDAAAFAAIFAIASAGYAPPKLQAALIRDAARLAGVAVLRPGGAVVSLRLRYQASGVAIEHTLTYSLATGALLSTRYVAGGLNTTVTTIRQVKVIAALPPGMP